MGGAASQHLILLQLPLNWYSYLQRVAPRTRYARCSLCQNTLLDVRT